MLNGLLMFFFVADNVTCAGVTCPPMRAQSSGCQPIRPPAACCHICGW